MKFWAISIITLILFSCSTPSADHIDPDMELGMDIAEQSTKALGGALKTAMAEGGVHTAIPFCNENALAITDSLARHYDVEIRRTSLHFRNPSNQPDSLETAVLVDYLQDNRNSKKLKPQLRSLNGKQHFFAPILTKPMCLTCHGMPGNELSNETMVVIQSKYPEDMATGFNTGDLRGMWSIQLTETK